MAGQFYRSNISLLKSCRGKTKLANSINNIKVNDWFRDAVRQLSLQTKSSDDSDGNGTSELPFQMPKYIKRSKTDILEALESTVLKPPNEPKMEFIDDPYLLPSTNQQRRIFPLAKASGIRAAKYAAKHYPKYFKAYQSVPEMPYQVGFKHEEDTLAGLQERIEERSPVTAFNCYKKLKEENIDIPKQVLKDLFGLLCFFNSKEINQADNVLESYYSPKSYKKSRTIENDWIADGPAIELFNALESPDEGDHNTLVQGYARWGAVENAFTHYNKMVNEKIPVELETYHRLFEILHYHVRTSITDRWDYTLRILKEIKDAGLQPTIHTFNCIMILLFKSRSFRKTRFLAQSVLAEIKECGLEPTLATWYHFLQIHYPTNRDHSNILNEVLEEMEGKSFTLTHPDDYEFFVSAMSKAKENLQDLDVAYRIHRILMHDRNIQFLGNYHHEISYYNRYLELILEQEEFEKAMKLYDEIVPHSVIPMYEAFMQIVNNVNMYNAYSYVPKLWSDMKYFRYERIENCVDGILMIMSREKHGNELQEQFMSICDELLEVVKQQRTIAVKRLNNNGEKDVHAEVKNYLVTGPMIGKIVQVYLNGDHLEHAWSVFDFYYKHRGQISMFPSQDSLLRLADLAFEDKNVPRVMQVLGIMFDVAYPDLEKLTLRAKAELDLTPQHLDTISSWR